MVLFMVSAVGEIRTSKHTLMGMNMKLHEASELTSSVGETGLKDESCEQGGLQHEQPRRAKRDALQRSRNIDRTRGTKAEHKEQPRRAPEGRNRQDERDEQERPKRSRETTTSDTDTTYQNERQREIYIYIERERERERETERQRKNRTPK